MRALFWLACGIVLLGGCTKRVESPTGTVAAPKDVQRIGASPGKEGGLPQPPDSIGK